MGRPRLGPPITFRLPLDLHAILAERADAHGITPDAYVRTRFIDALERHQVTSEAPSSTTTLVEPRWKNGKAP